MNTTLKLRVFWDFLLTWLCASRSPRDYPAQLPLSSLEVKAIERASGIALEEEEEDTDTDIARIKKAKDE